MNSNGTNSLITEFNDRPASRMLPGWLVSLMVHGLFFGVLVIGADRQGTPEGSGETFHDVGLFAKEDLPTDATESDAGTPDSADATAPASDAPLIAETPLDAAPAVPLQLPEVATIGAGPPLPTNLPAAASRPSTTGGQGPVRAAAGGSGLGARFGRSDGTSFFQVAAQGDRFCYVVDCSGSMDEGNAIGMARAELMASIERLDPGKQFQVLFYDSDLHPMLKGKQDVFFATDVNRTFARQFINNQQPDSGTLHHPALLFALRSAPDVIFFLTDGEMPDLTYRELRDLKEANRKNTQVHVIQFGRGAKLGPTNWLEQLAKDHQGTYRYRDVSVSSNRSK